VGEEPEVIRREIEDTRERMGETMDALSYKADVKTRAKDSVSEKMDTLKSKVTGAGDRVSDATPDTQQMKQGARRAAGVAQENPLGLGIGALAVGFLAGMLIPSTRVENEKLGPMADDVMGKVKETGQEALERGKQVASDAAQAAKDTAQEQGREQAQGLQQSARSSAQEVGGR
jgi:ElaB/YqjD/DUF883 family membrane-anchored ribosome-binding protein